MVVMWNCVQGCAPRVLGRRRQEHRQPHGHDAVLGQCARAPQPALLLRQNQERHQQVSIA